MMINKWFVSTVVLAFLVVGVFTVGYVQASPGKGMGQGLGAIDVGNELILPCDDLTASCEPVYKNCELPVPPPACSAGDTICMEGDKCQAASYSCTGTPGTWGAGTTCTFNACTHGSGTIGSKCQ